MELEEMKLLWVNMSKSLDQQKILTDKLIIDMTKERYNNRFSKLQIYESIGAVVCFIFAVFIAVNLTKLNTWYLMMFGIATILLLLLLPVITLRKIHNLKSLNIQESNYKELLIKFQRSKNELLITQKINIFLSYIFVVVLLPVSSKILADKDIFEMQNINKLLICIPIMVIFLFFLSRWGYRCYKSITDSAENILKDIDN